MSESTWKSIIQDHATIHAGQREYSFFDAREPGNENVLAPSEQEIVHIIRKNEAYLNLLLEESGFLHYDRVFTEFPRALLASDRGNGDFDLLVSSANMPPELVVFEFKRVKVKALDSSTDNVNKLSGVAGLFKQLEDRVKLGFAYVYGVLLLHGDIGARRTVNTVHRNYAKTTNDQVWELLVEKERDLPGEAGLIVVQFDHPTREHRRVNFSLRRLKFAVQSKQSEKLTTMYLEALNSGRAANYA